MMDRNRNTCCGCGDIIESCPKYCCKSCKSFFCENCIEELDSLREALPVHLKNTTKDGSNMKLCELCIELRKSSRNCFDKIYPSASPIGNPEPPSPSFNGEGFGVYSSSPLTRSSDAPSSVHSPPVLVHCSPCRSDDDDDEGEDSTSSFFGVLSEYFNDTSEFDSSIVSSRDVFYSFVEPKHSLETGPHLHSGGDGLQKDQNSSSLHDGFFPDKPAEKIWDTGCLTKFQQETKKWLKPLNLETNSLIWFPPPPESISGEVKSYTDDDDDEVGGSGQVYLPAADVDILVPSNDIDCKDPIKPLIQEHFRALVSQLLQAQHLGSTNDRTVGDWLEVITTIAWKAAKYIKPDTSNGGSMDPCDYVKVKCVASGSPGDSKLVKGIVCTKNIKHKRMISQYKNARLLILGGALEYQRVPNLLASVQTLLQQENDHLKAVVSKIEAYRPNVLVVEKTVSSCALEHLLSKEISLVLNVKRPLLEKIARCTGASIAPSTDHISMARLGHCELFHLEKVFEDHGPGSHLNRKPSKTLMYFEGCPRRLGCTIVLKGSTSEELKKVKHVVQYAVFAAYHLSLETSFLADEGASLPDIDINLSSVISPKIDSHIKPADCELNISRNDPGSGDLLLELGLEESWSELGNSNHDYFLVPDEIGYKKELFQECRDSHAVDDLYMGKPDYSIDFIKESLHHGENQVSEVDVSGPIKDGDAEQCLPNDNHQSILVSFSSHCMANGTTCERTRLLRVKFYGPSDKPLGRYLRDDLFNQSFLCKSCNEPTESHAIRYTHQNANLTIKVRHLLSVKLPGEQEGKIWMWHRCLQCELVEGVPPATGRVVMSDAAWGLSFAKFLELSFYNHITGNRVATCGHSLQRDCLRFYGFGSMIASFQYSHIDILSVYLPPPILEFNHPEEQRWIKKEAYELFGKVEALFIEVSSVLEEFQIKNLSGVDGFLDNDELHSHFTELQNMLVRDKRYYNDLQQLINEDIGQLDQVASEEISHLRYSLLICSQSWDCRFRLLEDMISKSISSESPSEYQDICGIDCAGYVNEMNDADKSNESSSPSEHVEEREKMCRKDVENAVNSSTTSLARRPSAASMLSDHIDSAWSGVDPSLFEDDGCLDDPSISRLQTNQRESSSTRRLKGTTRVYSFDSAQRNQERIRKGLPPSSLYLNTLRSFHASGEYRKMIRDPVGILRGPELLSPCEAGKLGLPSSALFIPELMALQNGQDDIVIMDLSKEPSSIIAYALCSKEYESQILFRQSTGILSKKLNALAAPGLSSWRSFGSVDSDLIKHRSFSSEDHNSSPHLQISFEDDTCKTIGRVKFSVMCYFAREFDDLRRKCCPSETDFIRSLNHCRKWGAQGGKSNVYFAKSLDERLVIKQVTKTELECFEEFGPDYFKYLTESLSSRSPTCLAKVLGMYQVTVKGGREMKKMDLMVMENLFYKRSISKVYDLKGSLRSRYISDTQGRNKVLLDMNLLETVCRNPIFVGRKAKRNLERAVWNDTSFLASVDVMDYSLLVGVDEERKELVMGIIDFMRQYTWDKQLETWVKASGILGGGGPKNASPTIISPKQYKKRFRKAMTSYFLTVPD